MPNASDGYVTDVAYVSTFFAELAPAWLDHVAIIHGIAPPKRNEGFTWCDLGCGLGSTATILAATHPTGRFVGIDFMSTHIECAKRFAADAAVGNVSFHLADFVAAADLDLELFDYVVVHGVYAWVDARTQQALGSFIRRRVKPGGLVYISYNAMPGRGPDIGFQRLLRTIAERGSGDSLTRMQEAMAVVRGLADLKPSGLEGLLAQVVQWEGRESRTDQYLAHELMAEHWQPQFVSDVRAAMDENGLTPVGSATLIQNYDSFVLRPAARQALSAINDDTARELARDFFLNQTFRRDVFAFRSHPLTETERQDRLSQTTFCLSRPASRVDYSLVTPAGRLSFDNEYARTIVGVLASGPKRLCELGDDQSASALTANMLALCAAGVARPVEGTRAPVTRLNAAIQTRLDGPEELLYCGLPCGTALKVDRAMLRDLRDGAPPDDSLADWRGLLDIHAVRDSDPRFPSGPRTG